MTDNDEREAEIFVWCIVVRKFEGETFFFFFSFFFVRSILAQVSPETQTALTSNRSEDCLWRCLISQTKGRSGERESGDSQSAYHRIDISMFPHGHGASPPWSITTGPRLLDQGFVCRRRASSVFSPFPAVHSFSTLRIPCSARFTTPWYTSCNIPAIPHIFCFFSNRLSSDEITFFYEFFFLPSRKWYRIPLALSFSRDSDRYRFPSNTGWSFIISCPEARTRPRKSRNPDEMEGNASLLTFP